MKQDKNKTGKAVVGPPLPPGRTRNKRLEKVLSAFYILDARFGVLFGHVLLAISYDEGLSVRTLCKATGIKRITMDNILESMEDNTRPGRPFRLIEIKAGWYDTRRKSVFLTADGKKALQRLETAVGTNDKETPD